jgi:hypothetical protein
MANQVDDLVCGCNRVDAPKMEGCACTPNQVLTCDEEVILSRMRSLKDQLRVLTEEMNNLQNRMGAGAGEQPNGELAKLSDQLNDLRTQWSDWQNKLEDAIERKWVLLGHREAIS